MTTEEKIKDMLNNPLAANNENYQSMILWAATEMAKWKDEQFKKYLKEKNLHLEMQGKCCDKKSGYYMAIQTLQSIISTISEELFGENIL